MTGILRVVLDYAAPGLPGFPVGPDKRPLVDGGFHAATTDPQTIERWFRQRAEAGIAISTGPGSGFWVLDLDLEQIDPQTDKVLRSGELTLADATRERHTVWGRPVQAWIEDGRGQ